MYKTELSLVYTSKYRCMNNNSAREKVCFMKMQFQLFWMYNEKCLKVTSSNIIMGSMKQKVLR